MIICTMEERPKEAVAVQLLILSLKRYCPDLPLYLNYCNIPKELSQWIHTLPLVELETKRKKEGLGWNFKPYLLLQLLERGEKEVWWIDSDILLTCDFRPLYSHLSDQTLVVTEEAPYGNTIDKGLRTKAWGFPLGNVSDFPFNSSVIRVTPYHLPLLKAWIDCIQTPEFQKAQTLPWNLRPPHLFGDQDVLTALLGSAHFKEIPVKPLRCGKEILHYFGYFAYPTKTRFFHLLHPLPPFIHAQGWKPWDITTSIQNQSWLRGKLIALYLETSPYRLLAKTYKNELKENREWLDQTSFLGSIFELLGLQHPALTGLPLAMGFDLVHGAKSCLNQKKINN